MARTSFGAGSPITPEFMNAVGYPKITGLPLDGHLDLLNNGNFDQAPGNVVYDFYDLANRLRSTKDAAGGLTLRIEGGTILSPNGSRVSIPAQTTNLPNNQISFVSFDSSGSLRVTPFNPPSGVRSARVTTGSGQITSIEDLRYDYLWTPNVNALAVFGGNSMVDYIAPPGITVLSGVLNCRDFVVGASSIIEVDRTLTVRASGTTSIQGTIRTRTNPVPFEGFGKPTLGLTTGQDVFTIKGKPPSNLGVPVTNRDKPQAYTGLSDSLITANSTTADRALYCLFDVAPNKVFIPSGTSGATLTIHSAGPVTLGPTSSINCSATSTAAITILPTVFSTSAHPITALAPTNWLVVQGIIPTQPVAGTFVCQSTTSVTVDAGANISTRGADKVMGQTYAVNVSGGGASTTTVSNFFRVGGGGGGAVHFQAPIVSSSPSAVITTSGGATPILAGETSSNYFDGPGSSGSGFTAATMSPATPGLITTVLAQPVEF